MKEITRITTIQITEIVKVPDEKMAGDKDAYAKTLAADMKKDYGFDDVQVLSVQDFVRDGQEDTSGQ